MLFTSAFSSLSQPTCTRSLNTRSTTAAATQLYEQPVNLKQLLGTASPAAMQKYNLLPETISDGFTAQIVTRIAKSTEESTDVLLAPKNSKDHFIDTVRVEIPLPLDSPPYGLGIELLEVEGGGREDGLGIVIVQGLVPGGNAERALLGQANDDEETIMQGDSISAVELLIRRTGRSSTEEQTDVLSARTECLGYDATVEAIGNLLSSLEDSSSNNNIEEATMVLTLRRVHKFKLSYTIHHHKTCHRKLSRYNWEIIYGCRCYKRESSLMTHWHRDMTVNRLVVVIAVVAGYVELVQYRLCVEENY